MKQEYKGRVLIVDDDPDIRENLGVRLAAQGYEVLSAFFLEAGFLGVMLFGRDKVGPKLHFFATVLHSLIRKKCRG